MLRNAGRIAPDWVAFLLRIRWLLWSGKRSSPLENMPSKLSRGESEAIVLAKELDAYLLVDELEARKEASRLGINYFGSLRIIKEAKDRGVISKAKAVLDDLIASSTYLDDSLYQQFLREMGEEKEALPK